MRMMDQLLSYVHEDSCSLIFPNHMSGWNFGGSEQRFKSMHDSWQYSNVICACECSAECAAFTSPSNHCFIFCVLAAK